LSRILGLVLVVVLAGVFSFVAYRKYDEMRRNPASLTVDATGGTPADPSDSPPPSPADENSKSSGFATPTPGAVPSTPKAATSIAGGDSASADPFGSSAEQGANHSVDGLAHSPQQNQAPPGKVSLAQTAGNPNVAATHEPEANPFGDLGGSPERQPHQAPAQSEPPQQFAGATVSPATPAKANAPSGLASTGSANSGNPELTAKSSPASTSHASPAGEDADMQNLFPTERTPKQDGPAPSSQKLATRSAPFEPTGLTRTADIHSQPALQQPAQNKLTQTPPTQGEPLDNETLEESRPPARPATDSRSLARVPPDSNGLTPGSASMSVRTADRTQSLLATKERTPIGDDSAFGDSSTSSGASPRPIPQALAQPRASNMTKIADGADPSRAAADDPFSSRQPSAGKLAGNPSGAVSPVDTAFSGPGRTTAAVRVVSPVGTNTDAGDFYLVQPQDNFWTISRKKYGTSRYFQALAELNKARIPEPARMRPGMKVSTPPAEMLEERYGQFLPPGTRVQVTAAEEASAKSAPTGFIVKSDGTPMYRTGEHDTLSAIAAQHLGRSSRWIQIYEMNRDKLSSPNQLKVGIELILPGDASSVGMLSEDEDRR
jgi:nucleoid-associated protein YgaU